MDPTFLILLALFALMYFVMIRPQRKKQQEREEMIESLTLDDDIITIGGLHGTVVALDEETVDLEVTDDIVLRFQRSSIGQVVGEEPEEGAEADEGSEDTVDEDAAAK